MVQSPPRGNKMVYCDVLSNTSLDYRPYQERIVTKTVDLFQGRYVGKNGRVKPPARSVMIESPTGSGKTGMALMACKLLEQEDDSLMVVWTSMRQALLKQAARENADLGINVKSARFVSMFQSDWSGILKERQGRRLMLLVDECLAGETLVYTLVDGKVCQVPIEDIVEGGVGSHVLSWDIDAGRSEWMPIVSRTCTGVKEVFEVVVDVDGRDVVVTATANHRFYVGDGEYKRLDELNVGDDLFVKDTDFTLQNDVQHEFEAASL